MKTKSYLQSVTAVVITAALLFVAGIATVNSFSHLDRNREISMQQKAGTLDPVPKEGMVFIRGGRFLMGYRNGHDDEKPVHEVTLDSFFLDAHEVTNRQFAEFVEATGHITQAEKDGYAWSYVKDNDNFQAIEGANWRHPEGPGSSIAKRMNHPVVCVSWHDAAAYAEWAGKRLPTEAEWEYAARAGNNGHFAAHEGRSHTAGASPGKGKSSPSIRSNDHAQAVSQATSPSSTHHSGAASPHDLHQTGQENEVTRIVANIWQGTWPENNALVDGFYYTAPVQSFEPNSWHLYDMIGNVWEWTSDWYAADYYANSPAKNPGGAKTGANRVARGGSWFCSPNYCGAYTTHFRGASPPSHAFNNVGFRCAANVRQ